MSEVVNKILILETKIQLLKDALLPFSEAWAKAVELAGNQPEETLEIIAKYQIKNNSFKNAKKIFENLEKDD